MDWWDDIWLNEGFATFISNKGQNSSQPDWHMEQFFLKDNHQRVLKSDGLENSRPIIADVKNPNEISGIFDGISYSKAASVIRMLEFAIGKDLFRDGIRNYLKKFSYGNARTQDLWNEINNVVKNVRNDRLFLK
jgi:aminopeptidase N